MPERSASAVLVLLFLTLALVAPPALAQSTGDIDGTIVDANGAPLPGVSVEAKSTALLGTRNVVTDMSGRFRFPALPPGAYTVSATLSGFTRSEASARVSLGATAQVPMVLQVAAVASEVVVTGDAPVVDTAKNVLGTSTSIDTIQKLPLQRNYTSIAQTVAGTGTSAGGGITVYGATGLENQYIIDGVNTTGIKIGDQGKVLNQEFVQEVEVKTGGYEAEYSRALGGVINVVTKSGGNEFHGDLFGYYDAEGLAAGDKNEDARNAVGAGELVLPKRLDVGADLGGYFLKDRLWFFGAYDRVNNDQDATYFRNREYGASTVTAVDPVTQTDETRTNLYSGKLTFRLGESHTVGLTAFGDPGRFDGALLAVVGADSARNGELEFGGTDLSAKWDGIFGPQFLAQLQYGHHEEKGWAVPASTALDIRNRRRSTDVFIGGSDLYAQEKYERDAIKLAGTFFLGAHEIKGGLDAERLDSSFFQAFGGGARVTNYLSSGTGAYRYSTSRYYAKVVNGSINCTARLDAQGNLVRGDFGVPGVGNALVPTLQDCLGYEVGAGVTNEPRTDNLGFFLQDSFKVTKNLTINAGVRYDTQTLKDASGDDRIKLKNEWSPRLGVVWDFLGNGRSKLTASYGRYYTVIPQDMQTRALGNEYTVFSYNYSQSQLDPISDPELFPYAYIQGGQITGDGIKGMFQDEIIAGAEYEILKNWSLGVKGIYKSLGRAIEDRCDLTDPRMPQLAQYVPQGSLTTCALVNPGEMGDLGNLKDPTNPECVGAGGLLTGDCESTNVRRYYRGVEVDVTHRFSNSFYVLASYVYSSLKGNYDGNEKQSNGQQNPNINADFDYIDLVPNNFGRLALDQRHQLKLSGTYVFPFGLTVGASFRYASGAPFAVSGYARSGYFSERYLLPNRGEMGDQPSQYEGDLHLEYNLRIGPATITPVLDVFNILDRQGAQRRSSVFNTLDAASNDPRHQIGQPGCTAENASYGNAACATNANYTKQTLWQNPRQVRLGARLSF